MAEVWYQCTPGTEIRGQRIAMTTEWTTGMVEMRRGTTRQRCKNLLCGPMKRKRRSWKQDTRYEGAFDAMLGDDPPSIDMKCGDKVDGFHRYML